MFTGASGPVTVTGAVGRAEDHRAADDPGPGPIVAGDDDQADGQAQVLSGNARAAGQGDGVGDVDVVTAQMVMSPSVVVMAAVASRFTLRPALIRTLPLVVVIAAAMLASRPQQITNCRWWR